MKNKRKGLQGNKRRFFISVDYPFIGANPDGLIQYKCHYEGLLEIKCPFSYRGLTIKDYAAKTDGCLEIVDDSILVKKNSFIFFFFFKYNIKWGSQEENGVISLYVQLKTVSLKL